MGFFHKHVDLKHLCIGMHERILNLGQELFYNLDELSIGLWFRERY